MGTVATNAIPIPTILKPTTDPDETIGNIIIGQEGNAAPISENADKAVDKAITSINLDMPKKADETDQMVTQDQMDRRQSVKEPDELLYFNHQGEVMDSPSTEVKNYSDPHQMGMDVGHLVGLSANEFARSMASNPVDLTNKSILDKLILQSVQKASQRYPKSSYLVATVYGFLSQELPDFADSLGPEYKRISSIYNGRCIAPNKVYINQSSNLSIVDEIGTVQSYTGTKGPIPSYDTFCGPMGPNDKPPMTLLGTYCMMHDIGYDREGYFNVEEDFKLISRISQNFTRMGYQEKVVAQVAVQWFSNVGIVLGTLKTRFLPKNIDEQVVDTGFGGVNDIYSKLVPAAQEATSDALLYGRQSETKLRDRTRTKFYQGVREGVEEIEKQTAGGVMGGGQSPTVGQSALLNQFLKLGVVTIS